MTVDFQESLLDFLDEQPAEARPGQTASRMVSAGFASVLFAA